MDLVGLIDNPEASEGTRYLAMTWDQRARLGRALAAHYVKGGNWNDCIGAAAFSAHVFAETNDITSWRVVADYIRNRFHYDGTALPAVVGDRTSDYADFPAIINAMSAMDKDDFTLLPGRELAHDIDSERFYLTWVLGLLLGFEGSALDHDQARVDSLLAIAEVVQDEGGGWFYPMRVPWVTARIVLGLCHAGQNYETSEVVRRACDWLRRPVAVGGALETWWRSGTRPWNTDEATTAMCLTALQRAGAPASPAVPTIMAWLLGQRAEWSREDHQVDLALVVEALLLYRTGGAELQEGVLALLQWALTVPDGGLPRVDTEIPKDNLRLPFVAAQLTVVIWATMMREFSAVIAHELRAYRPEIPAGGPTAPGGAAYDDAEPTRVVLEPGDVLAWRQAIDAVRVSLAAEIDDRDRAKGTVVVNERRSEQQGPGQAAQRPHLRGVPVYTGPRARRARGDGPSRLWRPLATPAASRRYRTVMRILSPSALTFLAGLFAGAGINMLTSVATGPADPPTSAIVVDSAMWVLAAAATTWLAHVEQLVNQKLAYRTTERFDTDEIANVRRDIRAELATRLRLAAATTLLTIVLSLLLLPRLSPVSW